jgi:hypothetical protein
MGFTGIVAAVIELDMLVVLSHAARADIATTDKLLKELCSCLAV